ncbi:unnamed protein product [Darwinula stevensoni]|uniref:Uncharacterized protein n=1 Tax=Darwinula stevensoni TaxID=69355 RepID=A0A7R9A7X7_9CRUS|nr:unnamed protein product [Darwinula stevensoni]CAG0893954.1 unnamed protein product [Darwinula stevensoni]
MDVEDVTKDGAKELVEKGVKEGEKNSVKEKVEKGNNKFRKTSLISAKKLVKKGAQDDSHGSGKKSGKKGIEKSDSVAEDSVNEGEDKEMDGDVEKDEGESQEGIESGALAKEDLKEGIESGALAKEDLKEGDKKLKKKSIMGSAKKLMKKDSQDDSHGSGKKSGKKGIEKSDSVPEDSVNEGEDKEMDGDVEKDERESKESMEELTLGKEDVEGGDKKLRKKSIIDGAKKLVKKGVKEVERVAKETVHEYEEKLVEAGLLDEKFDKDDAEDEKELGKDDDEEGEDGGKKSRRKSVMESAKRLMMKGVHEGAHKSGKKGVEEVECLAEDSIHGGEEKDVDAEEESESMECMEDGTLEKEDVEVGEKKRRKKSIVDGAKNLVKKGVREVERVAKETVHECEEKLVEIGLVGEKSDEDDAEDENELGKDGDEVGEKKFSKKGVLEGAKKLAMKGVKEGAKIAAQEGAGALAGAIPMVSLMTGAYSARKRIMENPDDPKAWVKAGLNVVAGAAGCIPVFGTAAYFAIDGVLLAHDAITASKAEKNKRKSKDNDEEKEAQKGWKKFSLHSFLSHVSKKPEMPIENPDKFMVPLNMSIYLFAPPGESLSLDEIARAMEEMLKGNFHYTMNETLDHFYPPESYCPDLMLLQLTHENDGIEVIPNTYWDFFQ